MTSALKNFPKAVNVVQTRKFLLFFFFSVKLLPTYQQDVAQ